MKILILFLQFSCCGVNNYKDWQNQTYIIEQDDGKVPDSCCFNVKNMTKCLNTPGDQEYEDHMNGCLDTFAKSMEGNKSTVVAVSGGMILAMVSIHLLYQKGALEGGSPYCRLHQSQTPNALPVNYQ